MIFAFPLQSWLFTLWIYRCLSRSEDLIFWGSCFRWIIMSISSSKTQAFKSWWRFLLTFSRLIVLFCPPTKISVFRSSFLSVIGEKLLQKWQKESQTLTFMKSLNKNQSTLKSQAKRENDQDKKRRAKEAALNLNQFPQKKTIKRRKKTNKRSVINQEKKRKVSNRSPNNNFWKSLRKKNSRSIGQCL